MQSTFSITESGRGLTDFSKIVSSIAVRFPDLAKATLEEIGAGYNNFIVTHAQVDGFNLKGLAQATIRNKRWRGSRYARIPWIERGRPGSLLSALSVKVTKGRTLSMYAGINDGAGFEPRDAKSISDPVVLASLLEKGVKKSNIPPRPIFKRAKKSFVTSGLLDESMARLAMQLLSHGGFRRGERVKLRSALNKMVVK